MSKQKIFQSSGYSILLIFLVLIPFITNPYSISILIFTAMNIILASSLRLIYISGQLSLAHGGMMTIGAYVSALLMTRLGMSSWAALLISGLGTGVFAYLVGFPLVRLKSVYFSMVTIFLAQMVILLASQWDSLTGGVRGIVDIPRPDPITISGLFNITFSSSSDYYYMILIIMFVFLLIIYAIEHSRIGITFKGISLGDNLAESIGINTIGFKVLAFSIGSCFAGFIGGFYSQYVTAITPDTFGFFFAIYIVVYMIVGGVGRFIGPILGAFILTIAPELLRPLKEVQPFIFGALLMAIIFFMPEGVIGLPQRLKGIFNKFSIKRNDLA
jgi:branched-chain amino acid transport system permease protein